MAKWYEKHFREDYLRIYDHRNEEEADRALRQLVPYLGLKEAMRVLDLCCGEGRHSRWLAQHGNQVVGVDLSPVLLQEAIGQSLNLPVMYMRADAREIPFVHEFDLVINMFTSFGYFAKDEENEQVIRRVNRALKLHGLFLLDYLNPERVKRSLQPFTKTLKDGMEILQYRTLENERVLKEIIVRDRDGERKYEENVRLYSSSEMESMLKRNGFAVRHLFGDYDASPYRSGESDRMIFICRKEAEVKL